MKVKDRMTPDPIIITSENTVPEAFRMMRDKGIRRPPVMDKGQMIGIVTMKELYEVSPSPATTLSVHEANYLLAKTKIMDILPKNMQVITIDANANIEEAAILMREHKIGGVPVMANGLLVGIITETDIFDAFIDFLGVNRTGTRIDMEVGERVGTVADITNIIAQHDSSVENIVLHPKAPDDVYELILRVDAVDSDDLVDSLRAKGYKVVEVVKKP